MRRAKTPQEKKTLSLEKDRRNSYGENDKSSRKNIPRAKARVNRANRHVEQRILDGAVGEPDEEVENAVEQHLLGRRRKVWRKWADQPLGKLLAQRAGKDDLPEDPSDRTPYH
jgi:hypothetical protein